MVKALVLEEKHRLSLRDIDLDRELGPDDVRIKIHTVGICGSDVHYYTHGRIGDFIVNAPMVLGHEASGIIIETGANVDQLKVGDRVCMEPGIPNFKSRATLLGIYNLDPSLTFWATPPIHGCLTPQIVHPASLTYKLPDEVSFAAGAMVEPLAVGMQAAVKSGITPGDIAIVTGAGPIGIVTALCALAGGCAKVYVSDIVAEKLKIAGDYKGIVPVDISKVNLNQFIKQETQGWGANILFECSGASAVWKTIFEPLCPAGKVVAVGMPIEPISFDLVAAQAKEIRIETIFRYANVYDRAIELLASGKVDVAPLISDTFAFKDSIAAFDRAAEGHPTDVKLQIVMDEI
ncbi:NAD(P)-dependent alcohol dehydrogenase [Bartonella sp. HY329]|uniref:NAD(P)-dependent alcohol dehydrogenase n=1 Tax=unclassified Bartonella TaxID=2645622 RepID=UPI0021C756D9|nr:MULTISPECIES: NAD(P)-dependent alcohol dehydrogenase [unclassified Bartonella]UXM94902.1 NAD(P)-dependent alcohol dehydrogenase [Bartonella sp. HY329]UXN09225.1 NAD(P)-dependent alcohol dehydrogenase [Bartonella sp. HY328]